MSNKSRLLLREEPTDGQIVMPMQCPQCKSEVVMKLSFQPGELGLWAPVLIAECDEHTYRFQFFNVSRKIDDYATRVAKEVAA